MSKFKKGDKIVCVVEFDEHKYGSRIGRYYTVAGTNTWTSGLGEKYQMLRLVGFGKSYKVNAMHFKKLSKLHKVLK